MKTHRFESLDALRGIAAATVVISHCSAFGLISNPALWAAIKWTPLRILWAGHQAVIFFFVLSGFALFTLLGSEGAKTGYARYALSRVIRLYPVYIVSVAAAFVSIVILGEMGFHWYHSPRGAEAVSFRAKDIVDHILMVGSFNTGVANPPIWSIVHEMRISLVFPLLVGVLIARPILLFSISSCISIALAAALIAPGSMRQAILSHWSWSYLCSLHYLTMFVGGALVARERIRLVAYVHRFRTWQAVTLTIGLLLLYMYPFDNPWTPGERFAGDLGSMLGAMGLIVLALAYPHVLAWSGFHFLGRISYSLYLVHAVWIGVLVSVLPKATPAPIVWLLILAGSLPLAVGCYQFVELPSLTWSRRVRHPRVSPVSDRSQTADVQ